MQVTVEQSGALERKMTITLPAEQIDTELNKQLQHLSRRVKVPGFRPGKVPMKIMKSRYQAQVMQDVIGDLIQDSYQKALIQESLHPAGAPSIQTNSAGEGEGLEYTAVFEVYPDLTDLRLSGLKVERKQCQISDEDVDRTLDSLARQHSTWNRVERAAQKGDRVTVDYEGKIDGEVFEGGSGKGMPVVIGFGSLIPGFEEQLLDLGEGDEKTFAIDFPDDYQVEKLAGKQASFSVTVTEVAEQQVPEIDDALAESYGVSEGGVEKFREEVRQNLSREAGDRLDAALRDAVFQAVLDANPIDIPVAMVERELKTLLESAEKEQAGVSANEELRAVYRKLAERRVALGLMLGEIAGREKLVPDPEKVDERLNQLADSYENPTAFVQWYKADRNRLREIEAQVLEYMVVDKLLEDAEVTDKQVTFQELVNPASDSTEPEGEEMEA